MSKKQSEERANVLCSPGRVVGDWVPDDIVGKVLTLIEAVGLPQKQEEALKGLLRQAIRGAFYDGVYISSERHTALREEWLKESKNEFANPGAVLK